MTRNITKRFAFLILMLAMVIGCTTEMKIDYELNKASIDMSKAYRQFQLADNAFYDGNEDAAIRHLARGYELFQASLDRLSKAEEEAYQGASDEIDKGNNELQKSIDEYNNGNVESAEKHYDKALAYYDKALDLLD